MKKKRSLKMSKGKKPVTRSDKYFLITHTLPELESLLYGLHPGYFALNGFCFMY